MSAIDDLMNELRENEIIESLVFGNWGWGGFEEPIPNPVPLNKRGVLLMWDEAQKYMNEWSFIGGFGCPECYAVYIWTNKRILWICEYDGSTRFSYIYRDSEDIPNYPTAVVPIIKEEYCR